MSASTRRELDRGRVANDDLTDWEGTGKTYWPAPRDSWSGRQLKVIWDVESCPLNATADAVNTREVSLNAQQTYDLLFNVFGKDCGVAYKSVSIDVVIGDDYLQRLGQNVKNNIRKHHSEYVQLCPCAGSNGGKPEQHSVWAKMIERVKVYLERSAKPGDILVLVTGDGRVLNIVRTAVQAHDVQVCLVHPNGENGMKATDPVWLAPGGEGHSLTIWSSPWRGLLMYHSSRSYNIRNPPELEDINRRRLILDGVRFEQEALGNLGIVLLIDITNSMQDVIQEIKERIRVQLLDELHSRYASLKGRMQFAVVAYRDVGCTKVIKDERLPVPQFEVLDFVNNVDQVSAFLDPLETYGGGDFPEDIAGALLAVCKLPGWAKRCGSKSVKPPTILFHIFDDPGHGERFHDHYKPGRKDICHESGWDRFWDAPPAGRDDPSKEIAKALLALRKDFNVIKYYAMTINRHKFNPAPTAKTVQALKDIAAGLPGQQREALPGSLDDSCANGMRDNWVEEVELGSDAATLVRRMIRASTRTLSLTTSVSRLNQLRGNPRHQAMKPKPINMDPDAERSLIAADIALEKCRLPPDNGPSLPTLPKPQSSPPAAKQAKAAEDVMHKSAVFNRWLSEGGEAVMRQLRQRFLSPKEGEWTQLNVTFRSLLTPLDLKDLVMRVDDRSYLDPVNLANKSITYRMLKAPFAMGGERYAFLALDWAERELHVFKQLHMGEGQQSKNRLEQLLTGQTIAGFLADQFNEEMDAFGKCFADEPRLKYLAGQIATCTDMDGNKRMMFQESFVLGRMRKFSGNSGYVAPAEDHLPVCAAFSHWTYFKTEGRLMVTDVQGWYDKEAKKVLLTDPCVHCCEHGLLDDPHKDRWLRGMEEFFQSHHCDRTCISLGLDKVSDPMMELENIRQRIVGSVSQPVQPRGATADASGATVLNDYMNMVASLLDEDKRVGSPTSSTDAAGNRLASVSSSNADSGTTANAKTSPVEPPRNGYRINTTRSMCKFFGRPGGCRDGDTCDFLHDRRECWHKRALGKCRFNDRCWYKHK